MRHMNHNTERGLLPHTAKEDLREGLRGWSTLTSITEQSSRRTLPHVALLG